MNKRFIELLEKCEIECKRRTVTQEFSNKLSVLQSFEGRNAPIKEAKALKLEVMEFPMVKIVESIKYTEGCFAFIGNIRNPNSWENRITNEDGSISKDLLVEATEVLAKKVAEGKETNDMALRILKAENKLKPESNRIQLFEEATIRTMGVSKGILDIVIIKPGLNETGDKLYPSDVLERDHKVFEGVKMFLDHPTDTENFERPERSLEDWVAVLENVRVDTNKNIIGTATIVHQGFKERVEMLDEAGKLEELGVSIRAFGEINKETIDGNSVIVVKSLIAVKSVDFVTTPGAGGHAVMLESQRGGNDVCLVDLETLKKKRPDLVEQIEQPLKVAKLQEEIQMDWEERFNKLEKDFQEFKESSKKKEDELSILLQEANTTIEEGKKKDKQAEVTLNIESAVDKTELPDSVKKKIKTQLKNCESLEEANRVIKLDIDMFAELSESGEIKGLGRNKNDNDNDNDSDGTEDLVESYYNQGINRGMDEDEAKKHAKEMANI